ncbi:TonB-dependent receptor [Chlorobaculum thiosulfatiphilum]|uniref:TonB-dependent receptor n=1 Tax=Chlorobaculum thiosulfatiphilum TaxID=115852 RepID=A0A5C4SA13_CHLTI|nr:TonB-dependent receptor [Chlorobaculum thiosulfatiphilum]TNJ40266.1 TonB-dependent receptor [Chlorobaculum thiosulfatiphilum]
MNKRTLATLMAAMLASPTLHAEETLLAYAGNEIVVTSSRVPQPKKELTSNVTIITKEEISESSANDLSELLAEKNLGHIQKYPGTSTSVGIRGFRTETHGNDLMGKVLVLLDGRRAGTGNLAKIMTSNVERIEIVRGPAAVQYGSAAIGGVINVITVKGSGAPSASIEQELGSNDFSKTEATIQGKSGRFDYSGSISKSDSGSYKTGKGETYQNTGYQDQKMASLNVGYEIADGHRIGMIVHSFDVDKAGSPSYLSSPDLDAYTVQNNHSVDFRYDGATSSRNVSWMARYFTGEDKYRYVDPSSGYESTKNVDQQGAQAQVTWQPGALRLTTGFDWLKYEVDSTLTPSWATYENPAGFLLGKYGLFDERLILTAGVRYDDYRVKMKASEGTSRSKDNFAHQAGVAWQASDALKFRGSFAEGFRMPSERELAANITSWGTTYIGNPDLKPEASDTYEVGMDLAWKGFNASLTWFSTDYTDMIQTEAIAASTYTYRNIGSATVSGIEAELSKVFKLDGSSWTLEPYAGYTHLLKYRDNTSGDDLLFTPQWNASTGLKVRDGRGFNGAFNLAYSGKTFVQNYETGSGEVVPKGGFAVANLSVSRKFPFGDKGITGPGITVKAEINNLFDRDYQYVTGYPMPGRTFVLGLKADI